ncbi:uncharacterized protein NPIL_159461 [Nephila pilipes]|uniref:Uncharacterized protein n=1 Tax=Nephila pilipes TaxID=299642 RepID=A0A8X6MZZ4_NEPPI|nr:uncharacterized protein NPIL_159461 [Nephila pilipes]
MKHTIKECLFYLPHHGVKKISNEETKCRTVFDASSHSPGHPSLSDALEIGPNLFTDIMASLLRFRLSKIAITCDGSQAFLQLILSDEDRDATRFFDNPEDHLTLGTFPSQLSALESWWYGPKWLTQNPESCPANDLSSHTQLLVEVELRKTEFQFFYVATLEPIVDISRYSSYTKLLRVVAWILRFVCN